MSHFIVNSPLMDTIMKTKRDVGNTTYNDSLLLPNGMLSVDSEKKALRFHDGQIAGGYEVMGQRAVVYTSPGPQELLVGDSEFGYYGVVSETEFVTNQWIYNELGVSEGSMSAGGTGWLKVIIQGKVLFVYKGMAGWSLSWNTINNAGAVYGDRVVTHNEYSFKARLLTGGNDDPSTVAGGEWDLIFTALTNGTFENFTYADIGRANNDTGYWCQETNINNANYRIKRGSNQSLFHYMTQGSASTNMTGWRPVLELIG